METVNLITRKIRIYPTPEQEKILWKGFGVRRWVYNWGIDAYFANYKNKNYITNYDLNKILNQCRRENPEEYGFLSEVNGMIREMALDDLYNSIKAWNKYHTKLFANPDHKITKKEYDKYRPKYKSKKNNEQSYKLRNKCRNFKHTITAHYINIPNKSKIDKINVYTKENISYLRQDKENPNKIHMMSIQYKSGKYYAYIVYERTNQSNIRNNNNKIGIDLGIKHLLAYYDGNTSGIFDIPNNIKYLENKIDKYQRIKDRKKYNSNNYKKTVLYLNKLYDKIHNIREDLQQKLTTKLCKNYHEIKIDDFSFQAAHNLKRSRRKLSVIAPYEFKIMLEYKSKIYDNIITYIPKFTPTTQTCSKCGNILHDDEKLSLKDRKYHCKLCGNNIDRDINSAINVYNY